MSENLRVAREGDVATIVFDREDKLNAMTREMWADLGDAMRALSADADLRCIVLRGAGTRAFGPGNDISEFEDKRSNVEQARAYGAIMSSTLEALLSCPIPMVAQIHGICVGGGLEIASTCDIRICGENSRFGAPINRLGLVMGHAELGAVARLIGPVRALELLLEGQIIDAAEAHRLGLVSRVVAPEAVATEVEATVGRIVAGAPLVARWHKKFVRRLQDPAPLTAAEIDEAYQCFGTKDFQTGYRAFLAKQTPVFRNQ